MKNYVDQFGNKEKVKLFQQGGATPQGEPDIQAMVTEYAQSKDPQLAVMIADALVMMMSQGAGGTPPPEAPPAAMGGSMPYKKDGGKLTFK